MEDRKIRVAITHGDTNGVGYELIFKTFEDPAMFELCIPIVYGSPKVATYHRKALEQQLNFTIVDNAEEAREGRLNLITTFEEEIKIELGQPSEESGNAALTAIDKALEDVKRGAVDVLVTAPVENNDAFRFSGQSCYIEDHIDASGKGLTFMVSDRLRVALATRNLPLKQVAESVNSELITEKVTTLHNSLRRDFRISSPRIAVLAVNPKAGDNGLLGTEEKDIIAPAVAQLADSGIQVYGPYAADELFGTGGYAAFDAVLAMYYEQGLMPFRSLTGGDGVNYTAGLPLVCTAPQHGVQFDLAGKQCADEASFRHAIFLAIDVFRNRINYDEPLANPLKKLYKEKRDDSEKVRFTIPKKKEQPQNTEE